MSKEHLGHLIPINQMAVSVTSLSNIVWTLLALTTLQVIKLQANSTLHLNMIKCQYGNTQGEPVFVIPLDTEVTPELLDEQSNFQLQDNQLSEENTTTLQAPIIPIEDSSSNLPQPSSLGQNDDNDNLEIPSDDEYYIVEYDCPSSPPTIQLQTTQIVNCEGDTELQEDLDNGWHIITYDVPANNPQFMDTPGLNFETNSREPEVFFNQLFDNRMFTIMAEETNNYARQQIMRIMGGRDQIQQIKHYSHKRHARLGMWRDVNESDITDIHRTYTYYVIS